MVFSYYDQRMIGQVTGVTPLTTRTEWVVISGDGRLLKSEQAVSYIDNGAPNDFVPYGDGTTALTDPDRMRKVTDLTIYNSGGVNAYLTLRIETSGASSVQVYQATLRTHETLRYASETGWVIYREDGSPTTSGADGTNGTNGTDGWTYLTLASNFANSTTTPADVTGVNFAALANTKYEVEIFGVYQTAATTTGIGMSVSVPSGASVAGFAWTPISTTALGSAMQRANPNPTGATASVDALNSDVPLMGKWVVETAGSAGTVQLRMRSEVASTATLIGGRFFLKYRAIA